MFRLISPCQSIAVVAAGKMHALFPTAQTCPNAHLHLMAQTQNSHDFNNPDSADGVFLRFVNCNILT